MQKRKWGDIVGEIVLELVLAVICGGIGFGIFKLVGIVWSWDTSDPDTLILVGILFLAAVAEIGGGAWGLIRFIRKKKK